MNYKKEADSFCIMMLPMLTDRQFVRVADALAKLLEETHKKGQTK